MFQVNIFALLISQPLNGMHNTSISLIITLECYQFFYQRLKKKAHFKKVLFS